MPTFHVYHAIPANFDYQFAAEARARVRAFPEEYVKVATVEADHVEDAYRATNNIHRLWIENPEVTVVSQFIRLKGGARSTSMGDVISLEDHVPMVVDFMGFKPLEEV